MSIESSYIRKLGGMAPDVSQVANSPFSAVAGATSVADQFRESAGQDLNLLRSQMDPTSQPPSNSANGEGGSAMNELLSTINSSRGLAKPNWFKVFITKPKQADNFHETVSLFVESAQFPPNILETAMLRTYGPPVEYPTMKTLENITLTFIIDLEMKVKQFFDNWMHVIVDNGKTNNVAFSEEYCTYLDIFQLDPSNDDIVYQVKLIGAYPKVVAAVDLRHDSQNQFHKLSVTFSYLQIEYNKGARLVTAGSGTSPSSPSSSSGFDDSSYSPTGDYSGMQSFGASEDNPYGMPPLAGPEFSSESFNTNDFLGSNYNNVRNVTNTINSQLLTFAAPVRNVQNIVNQGSAFMNNGLSPIHGFGY